MRLSKNLIIQAGERLGLNSKFYIYDYIIYEPAYYNKKKTKTYKPVTNQKRINKILMMYENKQNKYKKTKQITKKLKTKIRSKKFTNRFDIMDI